MSTPAKSGKRNRDSEENEDAAAADSHSLSKELRVFYDEVLARCLKGNGGSPKGIVKKVVKDHEGDIHFLCHLYQEPADSESFAGGKAPICINDIVQRLESGYFAKAAEAPELHTPEFPRSSQKEQRSLIRTAIARGLMLTLVELKNGYEEMPGVSMRGLASVCNGVLPGFIGPFLTGSIGTTRNIFDVTTAQLTVGPCVITDAETIPEHLRELHDAIMEEIQVEKLWDIKQLPYSNTNFSPICLQLWENKKDDPSRSSSNSSTSLTKILDDLKNGVVPKYALPYLAVNNNQASLKVILKAALLLHLTTQLLWLGNGIPNENVSANYRTIVNYLVRELEPFLPVPFPKGTGILVGAWCLQYLRKNFFLLEFSPSAAFNGHAQLADADREIKEFDATEDGPQPSQQVDTNDRAGSKESSDSNEISGDESSEEESSSIDGDDNYDAQADLSGDPSLISEVTPRILSDSDAATLRSSPLAQLVDMHSVQSQQGLPAWMSSASNLSVYLNQQFSARFKAAAIRAHEVERSQPIHRSHAFTKEPLTVQVILKGLGYLRSQTPLLRILMLHLAYLAKHTEQKGGPPRARGCCMAGCKLVSFETTHQSFGCDGCDQGIEVGATMFGCRQHDYDLCAKCHSAEADREVKEGSTRSQKELETCLFLVKVFHADDTKPPGSGSGSSTLLSDHMETCLRESLLGIRKKAAWTETDEQPEEKLGVDPPPVSRVAVNVPVPKAQQDRYIARLSFLTRLRSANARQLHQLKFPTPPVGSQPGEYSLMPRLLIIPSGIAVARFGLWIRGTLEKNTVIAQYAGLLEPQATTDLNGERDFNEESGYRLEISAGPVADRGIVDAKVERCLCSMINSAHASAFSNNCRFEARGEVSTIRMCQNEELFVPYGRSYKMRAHTGAGEPALALVPDWAERLVVSTVVVGKR